MTRLPHLSGREVVRALTKLGYEKDHQRGSHIVLRQSLHPYRRIVVPATTRSPKEHSEPSFEKLALRLLSSMH